MKLDDVDDQGVGPKPARGPLFSDARVRLVAWGWCLAWPVLLAMHLAGQLRAGWTDNVDRPFGEDFINFWSAARLAMTGASGSIYDIEAFHAFEVRVVGNAIDLYHYSYPPTLALLTFPFALLPYPVAWGAWQLLGWLAFALALRRFAPDGWLLVAFAWPAVFINAMGGQAGAWIAAILGWALILLPRRPLVAGLLLALLTVKPQLFWLVPIALLAGKQWRALIGLAVGGALLLALATLCFGVEIWPAYAQQAAMLKRVILEDGAGVWHRMISIFVLVRHLGAPLPLAYSAQALVSLAVAAMVFWAWHRDAPAKVPLLVTGMVVGSLYVSDYDCVILAFPAVWLWSQATGPRIWIVLAALLPLIAAVLAVSTGAAMGALLLWPLMLALWRANSFPAPGESNT
jgi:hypothetical protein